MNLQQAWESEAHNWARFARSPGHDRSHEDINLPALLDLLPPPQGRTLDLACGEGRMSRLLRSRGYDVTGADMSATMVRLAATHPGAAPAVRADATALPFADETFGLVLAYMCLHDIDEMPRAVGEAARVLQRSGRLCLVIPHPVNTAGSFPDRDGAAPFVISGSYLDQAPYTFTAERDGYRLTFHSTHRPLEAYFGALAQAGLLTEAVREVRAPGPAVARDPAARRWQRIPLFLQLRAIRP